MAEDDTLEMYDMKKQDASPSVNLRARTVYLVGENLMGSVPAL